MDQAASAGDAGAEVTRIEQLVERERGKIESLEERIARIDNGGTLDVTDSIRQQEEIRDTAWDRIQGDITYAEEQIDKIRTSLDSDLAIEQSKLDGLDAIVASYTTQGTTGNAFSRTDNVAKGLEVREEQKAERDAIDLKMKELRDYSETQIAGYRNQISQYRADTQATIDSANDEINRLRDNESNAQVGRDEQIDSLQAQIDDIFIRISDYNEDLFEKRSVVRQLDNEVGPVKYIAQLLYGESGTAAVDSAVQIVIILLIFVFDPLAIILVIAANLSFKERRGGRITAMAAPDVDVVIDDDIAPVEQALEQQADMRSRANAKDDVHIEMTTSEPFEEKMGNDWVADKYGDESAMDPKKEVDLQWLIDKKRKKDA